MHYGDCVIMREEKDIRLLKVGCKYDRVAYCVLGNGPTKHYEDYEDALEEFNLRWMKAKYGD